MKLYAIPPSPFVRKVLVTAQELDLAERLEVVPVTTSPLSPDPEVIRHNPLGRVPTLVRDDGPALYESGVICAYLNSLTPGVNLIPETGEARWQSARLHALADGIAEEGITIRREMSRPEDKQWTDWITAFEAKLARTYDLLEAEPALYEGSFEIGQIALACALDWVTFRAAGASPFENRPRLTAWHARITARSSMQATPPAAT